MRKFIVISAILLCICGACFAQQATPETITPATQIIAATPEVIPATVEVKTISVTPEEHISPKVQTAPSATKFRDVPDDHWAAESVYDLVNMGVTQGYPDGTFRGNNNITRYETAMFLSKLAGAIGQSGDQADMEIEKMRDDLRAEIRQLRAEIAEIKRMPVEGEEKPITGSFSSKIMFGNLIARNTSIEGEYAPVGPIVRYRLKTTFARNIGESAKLRINLDTMDSGFGGGSSDLSMKILDVEGNMKLDMGLDNPIDVKVTSGPGPVVHTEEADAQGNYIARSENGVVYVRPYNGINFSTKMSGIDIGLGYIARSINTFGEVQVNQINGSLGYNFPGMFFVPSFKLNTNIDYLSSNPQSNPAGPTDTKYTFDTSFMLSQKNKIGFLYSFGQGSAPHNALLGLEFDLLDAWDTGTTILFKYKKIGSEYLYENATLREDMFAGLDVFNRYIGSGGGLGLVDMGFEISQIVNESVNLISRVDWRLAPDNSYGTDNPQTSLVMEAGVSWNIATDTMFDALYRVEGIPSNADQSSDMTQISLSFKY